MRICLKKKTSIESENFEKHQEGHVLGIHWSEKGDFEYLVDFSKLGVYYVCASDADILNC